MWTQVSRAANAGEVAQYTTATPGLFQTPSDPSRTLPIKAGDELRPHQPETFN
jgi:hypothetical protein